MKTPLTLAFAIILAFIFSPALQSQQNKVVRLRGEIRQVLSDGMIVKSHLGTIKQPDYPCNSRHELISGDFLLTGHPIQDKKVDNDWYDVDAIEDGIFTFTNIHGVEKRIRKYKVVKAYY